MSRFAAAKKSIVDGTFDELAKAMNFYDMMVEEGQQYLESLDRHNQYFSPTLITDVQRKIPGMMSRYYQLAQEADGIKVFLEDHANVVKMKIFKKFTVGYARDLSDRTAEKYAEVDLEYVSLKELVGEINLRYQRLVGFTKGLNSIDFQIKSMIELRKMGIEDATL